MPPITARDLLRFQSGGNQQDIASYLVDLLTKADKMDDKMGYSYDFTRYNPRYSTIGQKYRTSGQIGETEDIPNIFNELFTQDDISFQDMGREDIEKLIMEGAVTPSRFIYDNGAGEYAGPSEADRRQKYSNFRWQDPDAVIANWLGIQEGFKGLDLENIQSRLSKELFLTESKKKRKEGDIRRRYTEGEAQSRYSELAGKETDDMSIGDLFSSFSGLERKSARGRRGIQEKYDEEIMENAMKWLSSMV